MTYRERYSPKIPFNPYLVLPVETKEYRINEGYIYSAEEHYIHGYHIHGGIDFDCAFGTPVVAAAAGLAVSTYHRFLVRNNDGSLRLYQGKPISSGFGYMVLIFHYENDTNGTGNRITQYGHLSAIDAKITPKFLPPKFKEIPKEFKQVYAVAQKYPWIQHKYGSTVTETDKEIYMHNHAEIRTLYDAHSPYVTYVEQGQQIGRVGNSAIIWGDLNHPEASPLISSPDGVPKLETWDAPHLHFEEATRDEQGQKVQRRDPFDLYLSRKWYQGKFKRTLFENF